MTIGILSSLTISAGMFFLVLLVLLFLLILRVNGKEDKTPVRKEVKEDLKKIKEQIYDD